MPKIGAITPVKKYIGNGVAKNFAFDFMYWAETEILVYLDDTRQTTGYSVTSTDKTKGGNINFDTPPKEKQRITIIRLIDIKRYSEFEESGLFRAAVINDELNRIVAEIQQLNETLSRCLKAEASSTKRPEDILNEFVVKAEENAINAENNKKYIEKAVTELSEKLAELKKLQNELYGEYILFYEPIDNFVNLKIKNSTFWDYEEL